MEGSCHFLNDQHAFYRIYCFIAKIDTPLRPRESIFAHEITHFAISTMISFPFIALIETIRVKFKDDCVHKAGVLLTRR